MCQTRSGMAFVTESCLCQTTILLLRFGAVSTRPCLRHEPFRVGRAPCALSASPAFHAAFPEAFGPCPRKTAALMPCHRKRLRESQPRARNRRGAGGEPGQALGPEPSVCRDTQIIFACGWQVLLAEAMFKCVVKVSIIPCSRRSRALEEQPGLQASPLPPAWVAHRLLQSPCLPPRC